MTALATLVVAAVVLLVAVYAVFRALLCALPSDRDGSFEAKLFFLTIRCEIRNNGSRGGNASENGADQMTGLLADPTQRDDRRGVARG